MGRPSVVPQNSSRRSPRQTNDFRNTTQILASNVFLSRLFQCLVKRAAVNVEPYGTRFQIRTGPSSASLTSNRNIKSEGKVVPSQCPRCGSSRAYKNPYYLDYVGQEFIRIWYRACKCLDCGTPRRDREKVYAFS